MNYKALNNLATMFFEAAENFSQNPFYGQRRTVNTYLGRILKWQAKSYLWLIVYIFWE